MQSHATYILGPVDVTFDGFMITALVWRFYVHLLEPISRLDRPLYSHKDATKPSSKTNSMTEGSIGLGIQEE